MKKTALATAISLCIGSGIACADTLSSATFTMYDAGGNLVGSADKTVTGSIGGGAWSVASSTPFYSYTWVAHGGTTFGPGTYTIDTMANGTPNPSYVITVGAGQVGGHILFDWGAPNTATSCGKQSCDIDVIEVWDVSTNSGVTTYTSADPTAWKKTGSGATTVLGPDGIRGTPMIDGAFLGFNANFDLKTSTLDPNTPTAGDFMVFTLMDTPVNGIDMLAHATDPNSKPLNLVSCSTPSTQNGTVSTDTNTDTCSYTPPAGVDNVTDTFTYTVTNGTLTSVPGTVSVDIGNQPPVCTNVSRTTATDVDITVAKSALVAACTDPDGPEPMSVTGFTQPAHGAVADNGSGGLVYTPANGYVGPDSFDYTVTDSRGGADTKSVNIDVSGAVFGNFTMLDPGGSTFGGTNDIVANWDGVSLCDNVNDPPSKCPMTLGSLTHQPFFGFEWNAHDIRVFAPGDYTFNTIEDGNHPLRLVVPSGYIGAHMLFNWGQADPNTACGVANCNIDVVLVWEKGGVFTSAPPGVLYQDVAGPVPALDCSYELVSRDVESFYPAPAPASNGIAGAAMVDGAFKGFSANFNINMTKGCPTGTIVNPVVSIGSPKLTKGGGGCTIGAADQTASSRGDIWILSGFIAWLGMSLRRRKRSAHH